MSNKHESGLKKYMSEKQRRQLGGLPTTHSNCLKACGVARPGKTARERAKDSSLTKAIKQMQKELKEVTPYEFGS